MSKQAQLRIAFGILGLAAIGVLVLYVIGFINQPLAMAAATGLIAFILVFIWALCLVVDWLDDRAMKRGRW